MLPGENRKMYLKRSAEGMKTEAPLSGNTACYRCLNEFYPGNSPDLYLLACGVENAASGRRPGARKRPGYHLYAVLSGRGEILLEGRSFSVRKGQLFLVRPDEMFELRTDPQHPLSCCWMSFDGTNAPSFTRMAGFEAGAGPLDCAVSAEGFHRLCEQVLSRPELTRSGALCRVGLLQQYIAMAMISREKQHAAAEPLPQGSIRGNYVEHAVIFIQNNYPRIQVADVSGYLKINRSYFSVLFTEKTGISPGSYLFRIRMRKGTEMLVGTSDSLQHIADYIGYENAMAFSKAFKRCYGLSPKAYRRLPPSRRPAPLLELPEWKNQITTSECGTAG